MSLNHIILGNPVPLNVEFQDVKVDGNETILGALNVTGSIGLSGNIAVANSFPIIAIRNNALNTNRATLQLSGRFNTVGAINIQQDQLGNLILDNTQAGANINFVTAGGGLINVPNLTCAGALSANSAAFTSSATLGGNSLVSSNRGIVTQIGGPTQTVTLNGPSGVITTDTLVHAGQSNIFFTLNNTSLVSSSVLQLSIVQYTGSTGIPYVTASAVSANSCNIIVWNVATAAVLNGNIQIAFQIS